MDFCAAGTSGKAQNLPSSLLFGIQWTIEHDSEKANRTAALGVNIT